ncbi:hypothetical protein [Saccharothrix deserti]|uniref:hypothetical protein n=1 Tax=Saccharothrix deserti TaxID=2593674 RepID=UPI001EE4DCF3|nr:hypothetical protein [Saccharothrix deserti]
MGFVLSTLLIATLACPIADPAPAGPRLPHQPDVPGPTNIEDGAVDVTTDGGKGVLLEFKTRRWTESGEKPAAPRRFVFLFDDSVRFNTTAFPTCDRTTIERDGVGACPAGSRVGGGTAELYPTGSADVAVFNAAFADGTRGVLITIPATGTILENTFERVSHPYRDRYTWGSDEIFPPSAVPPQDRAVTRAFTVTFGGRHDGRSFAETDTPVGRPMDFGVYSHYVTGQITLTEERTTRTS